MTGKMKKFSCVNCGNAFEVYPPDDKHPICSVEKPKEASGTIIEMKVLCSRDDCRHETILYWYKPAISIGIL